MHAVQGRLKAFGAQSLSNIAWSYATLGHTPSPKFLLELGDAAKGMWVVMAQSGVGVLGAAGDSCNVRPQEAQGRAGSA